jgi:hypothetical protein
MAQVIPPTHYYAASYPYGKCSDAHRRYIYSFTSRLARIAWVAESNRWRHQSGYREKLSPDELCRSEHAMEMRIVENVRPRRKTR